MLSTDSQGDKVTLLRRLNNNWYEGRLKNVEGIFPAAYVETLREPSGKSLFDSPVNVFFERKF